MSTRMSRNVIAGIILVGLAWGCSSSETSPAAPNADGGAGSSGSAGAAGTAGHAGAGGGGGAAGSAGSAGAAGAAGASGSAGNITAIWANEGGDKVAQDELRVGKPNGRKFHNSIFDGTRIKLEGARNEVVNFNLVLEAAQQTATKVHVAFDTLTGPGGATIQSKAASGNEVFSWVGRPIELFHVRYLQIKGLSRLGYENYYDERHVPERLRRPWTGNGEANAGTTWADRPDHDKLYPDIAVPIEMISTFDISAGQNQSIWADIYIPRDAAPGLYQGQVSITQDGASAASVPVELTVHKFTLPEAPTAKTMLAWSGENINERYLGQTYVPTGADTSRAKAIQDRHALMAHRHRISMIGDSSNIQDDDGVFDHPNAYFAARLKGDFFTAAQGYDGPGVGVGNNVYSVGTYGSWQSWGDSEQSMRQHSDGWASWFAANAPDTEFFLYLIDESQDYPQIETWSQWLKNNPGPGKNLMSMATIPLPQAVAHTPTLQIAASGAGIGVPAEWQGPASQYSNDPSRRFFLYNGSRPASGCFMTEDDGVALRVIGWIQYKKHINRWFYWESTYYNDFQGGSGKLNLFQSAHTFGSFDNVDTVQGETGDNYSNGDGVLFYPGTDKLFPGDSFGIDGPIASLRLKYWRRGLQDHDYLTMAAQSNPAAVQTLLQSIVPKVVWEVGVDELADPTYVHTDISWSTDPDVWEAARSQLAQIIDAATP
ncbi:MAG: DUF4091 domain-containing protein [Deltaproteobacteria bacterium]|nr:DUF4091 domain-containing protein [Deltaproteobacteria bacterium]